MSLLWPDRITAGLFPGPCWLRRGRIPLAAHVVSSSDDVSEELLRALREMLEELPKTLAKGARVDVVVSDAIGHSIALPWQERLTSPEQWLAYAHACFDARGTSLDDCWVLQAGFRHYARPGIGFALPDAWVVKLRDQIAERGFRLRTVLPVSAAAYWNSRKNGPGRSVLLLNEVMRITALTYETSRFCELDVQPVLDSRSDAAVRLLRRVATRFADIQNVEIWSTANDTLDEAILKHCLPSAQVNQLDHSWRRL